METEIVVALIGLLGVAFTSTATVLAVLLAREKREARKDRAIAESTIATLRVEVVASGCSSPSCPQRSPVVATISPASGAASAGPPSGTHPNTA